MEVLEWTDTHDRFRFKRDYGDFSTEFVFIVDHVNGGLKLERAKKIFTIGSFDISPDAMECVFKNIMNDALEIYIQYVKKISFINVPQIVPQLVVEHKVFHGKEPNEKKEVFLEGL